MGLVEEGYERALGSLRANITELGFSASPERHVNYFSVWSRDHSICALGAITTEDETLIRVAKRGILALLRRQTENGQVPSYIEIEGRRKVMGGLGAITSVDSNLWVIIAAAQIYRQTKDRRFISDANIERYRALGRLLKAFDSNDCGLIEVHVAGDWADIFNRYYHVLYDEALYYQALKSLAYLYEEKAERTKTIDPALLKRRAKRLRKDAARTKRKINRTFWFTPDTIGRVREEYMIINEIEGNFKYYMSHIMPFKMYWEHHFESLGNTLAILTDVADDKKRDSIIDYVFENSIDQPCPLTAMSPPVFPNEVSWQFIYAEREKPYEYHNGGIWPMIAGFWIKALVKAGRHDDARRQLERLASVLSEQGWLFHEYLHGKTLEPMGRTNQAWSAAGYILAYHAVTKHVQLFP